MPKQKARSTAYKIRKQREYGKKYRQRKLLKGKGFTLEVIGVNKKIKINQKKINQIIRNGRIVRFY